MAWHIKNTGELWAGPTHELIGRTFTGATRTSESMPLIWQEKKINPISSKPKQPRKKQPPKPKGASAWD